MFEQIPLDLDYSEAVQMDSLYLQNRSIKKREELLSSLPEEYSPDQVKYLIKIFLEDYLDQDEPQHLSVNKLIHNLDFNVVNPQVLMAFLVYLKDTQHLYKSFNSFYKSTINRLGSLGLDSDLILIDLGYQL